MWNKREAKKPFLWGRLFCCSGARYPHGLRRTGPIGYPTCRRAGTCMPSIKQNPLTRNCCLCARKQPHKTTDQGESPRGRIKGEGYSEHIISRTSRKCSGSVSAWPQISVSSISPQKKAVHDMNATGNGDSAFVVRKIHPVNVRNDHLIIVLMGGRR